MTRKERTFGVYIKILLNKLKTFRWGLLYESIDVIKKEDRNILSLGVYDGQLEEIVLNNEKRDPMTLRKDWFVAILEEKVAIIEYILGREGRRYFKKEVHFMLKGLDNVNPSASMLVEYMSIKLKQRYTAGQVVKLVAENLRRRSEVKGYCIEYKGRYSRQDRAGKEVAKGGIVSRGGTVDEAVGEVIMKYGVCGYKIKINKESNMLKYTYKIKERKVEIVDIKKKGSKKRSER